MLRWVQWLKYCVKSATKRCRFETAACVLASKLLAFCHLGTHNCHNLVNMLSLVADALVRHRDELWRL